MTCLICFSSNVVFINLINMYELLSIDTVLLSNKFLDIANNISIDNTLLLNYGYKTHYGPYTVFGSSFYEINTKNPLTYNDFVSIQSNFNSISDSKHFDYVYLANKIYFGNHVFLGAYKILFEEILWIKTYTDIKSNPGNMTSGYVPNETLSGISIYYIRELINDLKENKVSLRPILLHGIPKPNGTMRFIGIPHPLDKFMEKGLLLILEPIYELMIFLNTSHGFRENTNVHTGLKSIHGNIGYNWIIEGDIKGYFDNIDRNILISLLKKTIKDKQIIIFIRKLLNNKYFYKGKEEIRTKGVPQGSVLSPFFSNIYLHELDIFMVNIQSFYSILGIRIHYTRFADDFVILTDCGYDITVFIKTLVKDFLYSRLKIELNLSKTHVTSLNTNSALFLGVSIKNNKSKEIIMIVDPIRIEKRLESKGFLNSTYQPIINSNIVSNSKKYPSNKRLNYIINSYTSICNGLMNYYSFVSNKYIIKNVMIKLYKSLIYTVSNRYIKDVSNTKFNFTRRIIKENKIFHNFVNRLKNKLNKGIHFNLPTYKEQYLDYTLSYVRGKKLSPLYFKICCICLRRNKVIKLFHLKNIRFIDNLYELRLQMLRLNIKQIPVCNKCYNKIISDLDHNRLVKKQINPNFIFLYPDSDWVKFKYPVHQGDDIRSKMNKASNQTIKIKVKYSKRK
jgi:group II intron reverse transcriptase/maturase